MPTRATSRKKPKSRAKSKSKSRVQPKKYSIFGRKLTRKQIATIIGGSLGSLAGAGALAAGAHYGYKHYYPRFTTLPRESPPKYQPLNPQYEDTNQVEGFQTTTL